MSRVYKQKRSHYYFYDTVIDGIRIRRSTHQTNKKLADEVRLKWDQDIVKYGISQFQRGTTPESKLDGVCVDYLNRIKPICPSSDRFNQTKRTVNRFIEFCAANSILTPMDITKQIIEAFIRHLSVGDKLASKTVRNIIQIISQMFNDWVGMDIMQKNPCLYVKLPKQRQVRENRVLTAEDINIILNDSSNWRSYYLVLLETGLRAGDAACIFYEDFDLQSKLLKVRISKIGKVYNLSVSDRLIEDLDIVAGKKGPVFPKLYNTDPQKVNDRTAISRKHLQKILHQNQRPHATLHSFRHTFNHLLSLSGVSMSDRQILLAHSSTNTTKIYSHPDQNLQKSIINALSQTIRELEKST